jgi:hypothetical protein
VRNKEATIYGAFKLIRLSMIGRGIIKTISISKIMKMIPKRKNRKEKGIRAEDLGSNPHSNGEVFSRSFSVRIFKAQAAMAVKDLSREATVRAVRVIDIGQKYIYIFS